MPAPVHSAFKCFNVVGRFRYYDTGIVIVPWFYDFFNALDVLMFLFFLAVVSLHIYHIVLSKSVRHLSTRAATLA